MEVRYYRGNPAFPIERKGGGIGSIWEMELKKGESVNPHAHTEGVEVYVILGGMGEMTVGDEKNTVVEGDAVYIPPGEAHTVSNVMDQPLHVVGLLLADRTVAIHAASTEMALGSCDDNVFGQLDTEGALESIRRLVSFAGQVREQIEKSEGPAKEKTAQVQSLHKAVMDAIGNIWQNFRRAQ